MVTGSPAGSVVVIGAGVAGLAAAEKLRGKGWHVRVIEKSAHAGGTHRARHIGPYTFDVGSIFYEDKAGIFDLVPEAKSLCPTVMRMQRRIAPDGSIRHYPLDPREVLRERWTVVVRSLCDLVWSRATVQRDGTLEAIARKRLGKSFLTNTGLASYIERFHHVPAREVDESFFFHRMGYIARATRFDVLARLILRSVFTSRPVGARTRRPLHVRPREGFEPLFEPLVARLKWSGVEFSFGDELLAVRAENDKYVVETLSGTHVVDAVVSTIPVDQIYRAVFNQPSGLVSLDMTTLFISASWLDPGLGNVLFNFHSKGWWKRATIYSRIYTGAVTDREFFSVETTISQNGIYAPEATFDDFQRHIYALGFARDLVLEGHEKVENCYPLYSPGAKGQIAKVIDQLSSYGLILVGRQGRFEYLPTSTGVIRRVAEELNAEGILRSAPPSEFVPPRKSIRKAG